MATRDAVNDLPPGFVLQDMQDKPDELPPGFVLHPPDKPAAGQKPAGGLMDWIKRGYAANDRLGEEIKSATVRPLLTGIASMPLLPADAGVGLVNFLKEKRMPTWQDFNPLRTPATPPGALEMPGQTFRRNLDQVTTAPKTKTGKIAEAISSIIVGAKLPTGQIGPAVPENFVKPAQSVWDTYSQGANAPSSASASANATGGVASASNTLNIAPEARASGGGYTFGTVGEDAAAGLTDMQKEILRRGQQLGMRSTPGQATGSRALQQMEAKLESQPMTSGPFNTIKANNADVINRAATHAIGEAGSSLDASVIDKAFSRIGGVFEKVADDVPRKIDPQEFMTKYSQIQDDLRGLYSGFETHPLVEDFAKLAETGEATGKQLQSLTSKLGRAAYKQMSTPSGDRDLGIGLYNLKDYVDDILRSGLSPSLGKQFDAARAQYRNLMLLTSRVHIVNPSTGNVNGVSLANLLQSKDKLGFLRGQNSTPLYDAARYAQAFKPIVGDSGTATRMPLQGLTDLVTRVPANIATRLYVSGPSISLATQAAAAARAVPPFARGILGTPITGAAGFNPLLIPPAYQGMQGIMGQ